MALPEQRWIVFISRNASVENDRRAEAIATISSSEGEPFRVSQYSARHDCRPATIAGRMVTLRLFRMFLPSSLHLDRRRRDLPIC